MVDQFTEKITTGIWTSLLQRIQAHNATVGILGLGYVGLPLAAAFARKGFSVLGYDVDAEKVDALNAGASYILDVPAEAVRELVQQHRLCATTEMEPMREADAVIICVPTPCQHGRQPDLRYIEEAGRAIAAILRPGQLVILESTTYPGTTEEVLLPILERSGLRHANDFQLAFSPERIDPGNRQYSVENTPKIVGGLGEMAGDLTCALYGSIIARVVHVSSPREAEMAKLIENTFRHINIALANELAIIARTMGINIWEAIDAAATKPYGFMPFYPGPGVGGHCIPIDPHYLSWKAREMGAEVSFIELAERINSQMPDYVMRLTIDAINRAGKSICGARILVIGLAYKRDIDDLRESPALRLLELLYDYGADVCYHDPYVPEYTLRGKRMQSCDITPETLQTIDCAVIITDHSCIDTTLLVKHTPLLVDTRNCLRAYEADHIIRL